MPQTFEELVGRDLDALYGGALFLVGGHEAGAEDLLLATLREAFHAYRGSGVSSAETERWLEGRLAGRALVEVTPGEPREGVSGEPLYRSVAGLSIRSRVALWLVLLRRWSYDATAQQIGVDRGELQELLKRRETIASAIVAPGRRAENG